MIGCDFLEEFKLGHLTALGRPREEGKERFARFCFAFPPFPVRFREKLTCTSKII